MNSHQHAHGCEAANPERHGAAGIHAPRPTGPHSKTTQHQVREIHRLVDNAMEDLEQVVRALRYLERDV
jgi:hypothetical protein